MYIRPLFRVQLSTEKYSTTYLTEEELAEIDKHIVVTEIEKGKPTGN